jgi:hypothetical protein
MTESADGMTGTEVLHALIGSEQDVFAVRRQARELAAALGMTGRDEIRLAAALSEVTRQLLAALGPSTVVFTVTTMPRPMLRFAARSGGVAGPDLVEALSVTQRLMEDWRLDTSDGITVVAMGRRLPEETRQRTADELRQIATEVSAVTAGTPLDELAEHNRQLLATLSEVQAQRDELLRLNAELQETNRGVMALYTELSEELAATNRRGRALRRAG